MTKGKVEIKDQVNVSDFNEVKISVASPEAILDWSHGEVFKPETINYRTQKPERDGLFCERIFGPIKDYECYCGKYKKIRYKGIVCDKCGVEVTRSAVRRIRMGHIDLAVPVAHIWYVRGISSAIAAILNITSTSLERIIYFASFVTMEINQEVLSQSTESLESEYKKYLDEIKNDQSAGSDASRELKKQKINAAYQNAKSELKDIKVGEIISEQKYHDLTLKYGQIITVNIGAEAIKELLSRIDLEKEIEKTSGDLKKDSGINRRRSLKRLKLLYNLKNAQIEPKWLILNRIPVIPPDLRPMVQLDGGRFAASDLNDLYRRVLNRNNRLKRLITQEAPEVICRNEKRMLQEAVDALIDNAARKGKVAQSAGGKRKLRSLSDMIRGKQGRFRQNLLGKRVDYSGRSVIVVGPKLKLHQCGIPKVMALELFKPFVIGRLIKDGYVHNVKNATRLIDRKEEFIWDILEDITRNHHVLLNRAPTLHRLGIQAFQPVLIEGKAIQIHPLVCSAFNADFDGDQMAVHVPLSKLAKKEAKEILLSTNNLLKPASGQPIVTPRQDMILGLYYLTLDNKSKTEEEKMYSSIDEAIVAYDLNKISLHQKIKVFDNDNVMIKTTVGKVLINEVIPDEIGFVNTTLDDKGIQKLISEIYRKLGSEKTVAVVDNLKNLGFKFAQKSGITFSASDIKVPANKKSILNEAEKKLSQIDNLYQKGLLTDQEKYSKTVELWMEVSNKIEKDMISGFLPGNDIYTIYKSGARGNVSQINQIAGMKGLVADPTGNIIELPIRSNFKDGLSVFEYFVSTHGSRKGRADTALRTSEAGYLTRRLVDVSQDTVISEKYCGTKNARVISQELYGDKEEWTKHIIGRVLAKSIGKIKKGQLVTETDVKIIEESGVKSVEIFSILGCESENGVCQYCYGQDLATGELVNIGSTVGVVAAQAIGEPGTQLTMRTFHTGGAAGEDITSGLPRIEELFEARTPKNPACVADFAGIVTMEKKNNEISVIVSGSEEKDHQIVIPKEYSLEVKNGDNVKAKQIIAQSKKKKVLRAPVSGKVKVSKGKVTIFGKGKIIKEYIIPKVTPLLVTEGDKVIKGQALSEGHYDLKQSMELRGSQATQNYIITEVQKIYLSQGQHINDKHLEVIVKQMTSKAKIVWSDDHMNYLPGQIVSVKQLEEENYQRKKSGNKLVEYQNIIMGMSRVALRTKSFLSAASFMETTSVLVDAAMSGKTDQLEGLKENIIIGKLIPAGTGLISKSFDQK